eukprot:623327-Rhodomonas_salina.1
MGGVVVAGAGAVAMRRCCRHLVVRTSLAKNAIPCRQPQYNSASLQAEAAADEGVVGEGLTERAWSLRA